MMLAALGKTLLKGKAKKIAKDKLLNRKKNKTKKKTSGKEMSADIMNKDKEKRGGALAVRPTTDLVGNIKDFDPVSDTSGESDIIIIRKQVIQVRDILKDSYTAKKEERDEERKARQTEKREKREDELEKSKVKPKESKGKMPNIKLGIGNFLSWLVFGLVVNKLIEWMPTLKKIFKVLKPIANFIGGLFKKTIGFVVGFIDLSYAGVEKLEKAMEAIGGKGGKELFEKFGKLFTTLLNGALIAALVAIRVGLFNRKPRIKQPKRSFSDQVKRRRNLNKRFFDPKRGLKARRVRNIKRLRKLRLKRVKDFGRLRRFLRFKKFGKKILNFKNLKNLKNLRGGVIGMLSDMGVDRLFPNQAKNVANLQSRVSKNLKNFKPGQTLKNVGEGVTDVASKAKNVAKTTAKNLSTAAKTTTKNLSTAAKTTTKNLSTTAKKLSTAVKSTAKELTPAVKSTAKKLSTTAKKLTPALKSTTKTLSTAAKTTGKSTLKAVSGTLKSAKKIISPIVKKIPFIGALIDFALNYFVFKEPLGKSAFMAIGAGVGTWLGGMLGTLIPVPFVGTAIGAFVGGAGGDMLAGAIYDAIFKEKEPKKEEGEDKKIKEEKTLSENIISNDTQSKAEGLDTHTSYAQGGMMVVKDTTLAIQPIEV